MDAKNALERRCPRLGGPVTFQYCKECGEDDLPCFKVLDCWWEAFDAVAYFKACLSEDQMNRLIHAKPKPKISSLIDLIRQAKKQ
jgi:hypothetical protein